MNVLVSEKDGNQFKRLGVYTIRENLCMSLPMKYNGQVSGCLIRSSARYLAKEPAVNYVDCQFGSSPMYRVSRTGETNGRMGGQDRKGTD
ncbi:hypothetical protein COS16_00645 [Candidatus Desantisbacteria bacterium CG02_land_8_20_14_3_00_49_13]|nr:MAG: hypothetical protein COS16_00645 [Candidatus Desantisbacteria bacterium CG02_land_8_20_14_3_00_49_13]